MKPETRLYHSLKTLLAPYSVHFDRIENSVNTGIPDIYFVTPENEGYIELKQIKAYPKNATTTIKIPFRPGQYAWFRRRLKLNSLTNYFLLLQVAGQLYVFHNKGVREEYTRQELNDYSIIVVTKSSGKNNGKGLFLALSSP